jgi:hypothetical protein
MAYSNIKDPSAYFQALTYTGNGTTTNNVTNTGNSNLQPDWVWIKQRSGTQDHVVTDSSRDGEVASGTNLVLTSNTAEAEASSTGFGINYATNGINFDAAWAKVNASGQTYVAWQWKANGGTTSSNTDGDITSTVQVNSDAGFSIVTYTGNFTGSQGVGHGLGVRPDVVIIKNRDAGLAWVVWTSELTSGNFLKLEATDAQASSSRIYQNGYTTSTFGIGANNAVNKSGDDLIAYCFAEKQGYSKFGKYTGNGSQNGPMLYTGFKPAFVIMKRTDSAGAWHVFDNKRSGYNYANDVIQADVPDAELSGQTYQFVDLISNGFKVRRATHGPNVSGGTYIYMAFAENPFVAGGIPTTAR